MPRLSKFEMEVLEKRARGQVVWGLYGGFVREQNLSNECDDLRSRLRSERCSKREIDDKVEEHKHNTLTSISARRLVIGG